jgi:hypothetical protein
VRASNQEQTESSIILSTIERPGDLFAHFDCFRLSVAGPFGSATSLLVRTTRKDARPAEGREIFGEFASQ